MWDRFERSSAPIQGTFRLILVFAASLVGLNAALAPLEGASGPIRVSENGRYFVDDQDKPFYFLADTQWELFRGTFPSSGARDFSRPAEWADAILAVSSLSDRSPIPK